MTNSDHMTAQKSFFHFLTIFAIFCIVVTTKPAQAAESKLLGTFGAWQAFEFIENNNKVCYMASNPKKAEGKYTKRGEVFALVTHRPSENTKDVFSYITGYTYKQGKEVNVKIGRQNFKLFTQGDGAWTPDAETDKAMAKAIQSGSTMVVKGTSSRGTLTTDTFSLSGSGAAYKAISKACGL